MVIGEVESFLLLIALGYLLMWLFKKQPLSLSGARLLDKIIKQNYFEELLNCYLCLGVWTFSLLSWLFKFTIITVGIPILDVLITGSVTSFVGYLLFRGWESSFTNIIIRS